MPEPTESSFELVFEGPADSSAETLRKLKGAFIADLEMSISQVQEILTNYPATVKCAASSNDLQFFLKTLKNAGAKATIVQKGAEEDFTLNIAAPVDDEEAEATWVKQSKQKSTQATEIDDNEEEEMEFVFEVETPQKPKQSRPKEYTLSMDEADSIIPEYLLKQPPVQSAAPAPMDDEPLFKLGEEPDQSQLKSGPLEGKEAQTEDFLAAPGDLGLTLAIDPEEGSEAAVIPDKPAPPEFDELDLSLNDEPVLPAKESTSPPPPTQSPQPLVGDLPLETVSEEAATGVIDKRAPGIRGPISISTPLAELQKRNRTAKPLSHDRSAEDNVAAGEPVEPPAPPPPPRLRRRKSPLRKLVDTTLPLVVGILLLAVGNWYYFSLNKTEISPAVLGKILKMLGSEDGSDAPVAKGAGTGTKNNSPAEVLPSIKGQSSEHGVNATWNIPLQDDKPSALNLTVTAPKPAELTPEEIVANKVQAPWLKKITVESRSLPQNADGSFLVKGSARTYVEHHRTGYRLLSQAVVRGRIDPATRKVSGRVEIKLGLESSPNGKNFFIEETGPGRYNLYISAPFGD